MTQETDFPPNPVFVPREIFSPSQIGVFRDCQAKWGYTYLLGKRGAPTKAAQLGTRIHTQLERHFWGEPMDLERDPEACRRAIAGLHLFPDPSEASEIRVEGVITYQGGYDDLHRAQKISINFDTKPVLGESILLNGYVDLSMGFGAPTAHTSGGKKGLDWYLFDHKSCRTYEYQLTPEDLGSDLQGNIYAYDLMVGQQVEYVPARWVYTRTEGAPDARSTDWTFTLEETISNLKILLAPTFEMRDLVKLRRAENLDVESLPKNKDSCPKYGGCPHHPRKGGPCPIGLDLGKLLSPKEPKELKAESQMVESSLAANLRKLREQQAVAAQPAPAPAVVAPTTKVPTLRIPGKATPPAGVKVASRNPVSPPEAQYEPAEEEDLPPVEAEAVEEPVDTEPTPALKTRGRPKGAKAAPKAREPEPTDDDAEKKYFVKEAALAFAPTRVNSDPEVSALECAVFGQQLWEHIHGKGE